MEEVADDFSSQEGQLQVVFPLQDSDQSDYYDGYNPYPVEEPMPRIFEICREADDDMGRIVEQWRECMQSGVSFRQFYDKKTILMYFMDWHRRVSLSDSLPVLQFLVEVCQLQPAVQINNKSAISIALEVCRLDWLQYLQRSSCVVDVNPHLTQDVLDGLMVGECYLDMLRYLVEVCDLQEEWIGYCLMTELWDVANVSNNPVKYVFYEYLHSARCRKFDFSKLTKGMLNKLQVLSAKCLQPVLDHCKSFEELYVVVTQWKRELQSNRRK